MPVQFTPFGVLNQNAYNLKDPSVKRAKAAIAQSQGQVNLWVHPYFSSGYIYPNSTNPGLKAIAKYVPKERLDAFTQRVEARIAVDPRPLFISVAERDMPATLDRLEGLAFAADFVVIVPTEFMGPRPSEAAVGDSHYPWVTHNRVARTLGVRSYEVFGELYYVTPWMRSDGCVDGAIDNLRFDFDVTMPQELVFPNIDFSQDLPPEQVPVVKALFEDAFRMMRGF